MQRSFQAEDVEEDNMDFEILLNELYGNDPKARRAMD